MSRSHIVSPIAPQYRPIYTLLPPGLERRLEYSRYSRINNRSRSRYTREISHYYREINEHTGEGSYYNREINENTRERSYYNREINENTRERNHYYIEINGDDNCITLNRLLLKTHVMINKEKDVCCAICVEDILENTEVIRKLECNHIYHIECIDNWLILKAQCPMCKLHI